MELKMVKGIGPKSEALLNKLGINNVDDLVTYYPIRYEIYKRSNLDEVTAEERIVIDGKVESTPIVLRFNKGLNKMNFRLKMKDGMVGVSIFNRAFMKSNLTIGTNVIVIGKFDKTKNIINASDIKFGYLGLEAKIEPIYHLTTGLTNKSILSYINYGIMLYGKDIPDFLPNYLKERYHFGNKSITLNVVHNPDDNKKLEFMIKRLKYEELFKFMVKINYLKEKNKKENGLKRNITENNIKEFYQLLPFELTGDQKKVINEIVDDMNSKKIMNRLVQGDVGSGKTIVSFAAMYFNKLSGYQSALMAPTEILATQHYNNLKKILDNKLNIRLLIGSLTKKEKKKIYDELENGQIDIIIGTHALIQEDVKYFNLGLVITDEQHRFGVNQRTNLKNKGISPDVLYMSATPIPRTFALTLYGDMDVSTIKEMPKGRIPVKTIVKKDEEIASVLELMYEELKLKHQIYVIAPLIEGEDENLASVNNLLDKMTLAFGSKYCISILHGKMNNALKDDVMLKFKNNETDILISTTVIEVGVDVPNASMIVIFDANRFGLSTLHQLRGRVGRGNIVSTCILISKNETERLRILEKTSDGFIIAEEDFKLRGSGDLFGTKQSGDMTFKIAKLPDDYKILTAANNDAKEFLKMNDIETMKLKQTIINEFDN